MASQFYDWHHGHVHYRRQGLGDPLLLVHNVYPGASLDEYERNLDALSRHFTVYALDLLGFGRSDRPRYFYTAATYVELIFDFLREVVGEPAHVVASGLSAAYVAEAATWRESLFRKLVFLCPRSEPTGLDIPRWFAPIRHFLLTVPPVGSGFYDTRTGTYEIREYLRNCFFSTREVTEDRVERLRACASADGSIYPYASLITGYLDSDLLASLPKVDLPLLLIWGRQARPTPVEHSVRLAALARQGRLEVVEQAGAWVHLEQSAKVNALIATFLNDTAAVPAVAATPGGRP